MAGISHQFGFVTKRNKHNVNKTLKEVQNTASTCPLACKWSCYIMQEATRLVSIQ